MLIPSRTTLGPLLNRRSFLKIAGANVVAAALSSGVRAEAGRRPPNILLILTDDQGYQDVGCYGAKRFRTPILDRLAAEGMRFTDFYSAAAVCTPARAALLTGCYPPRVRMESVLFPDSTTGLNPSEQTLPSVLKQAGYATACFGKWHLGHHPEFLPPRHGFDEFFGLPYSNDLIPADQPGGRRGSMYPPLPLLEGEKTIEENPDQSRLTQRFTERAVRFIRKQAQRPFFVYLAHSMPHVPVFASDRFAGRSQGGKYGDAMEEIDWSTGEILRTVRELGLENDTILVFTSDNGPWLRSGKYGDLVSADEEGSAGPLRGGKFTTYEGGFRVPCIVYGPGRVAAGAVCGELCTSMDLLPTFARLAGAPLKNEVIVDGRDIGSLLAGESVAPSPHDCFFYYRGERVEAIRRGHWKLRQTEAGTPPVPLTELYDLATDVGEERNVAREQPAVVQRLQEEMAAFDARLKKNRRPAGAVAASRKTKGPSSR
jgi:arylsulfatase A-like enzyme